MSSYVNVSLYLDRKLRAHARTHTHNSNNIFYSFYVNAQVFVILYNIIILPIGYICIFYVRTYH